MHIYMDLIFFPILVPMFFTYLVCLIFILKKLFKKLYNKMNILAEVKIQNIVQLNRLLFVKIFYVICNYLIFFVIPLVLLVYLVK